MSEQEDKLRQVKIKFFTSSEDETIQLSSSSDQALFVPENLKRYGLSEILNHLLKDNLTSPVPFDFLINGEILRTSLRDYLISKGLSSEILLNLEYKKAVLPPSYLNNFNNDDWISSLDLQNQNVLSGSYDGIVRTWDMSGNIKKQYQGHHGAIKAVKYISDTRIVSGSLDRTLRLWKTAAESESLEDDNTEEGKTLAILEGHDAAVVSIDVQDNRILSASHDNSIGIWSTNYKEMNIVDSLSKQNFGEAKGSTQTQKRRKMADKDGSTRRRAPLALLESHTAPVEDIIFDRNDSSVAYSVSQDHTIKTWDLVTNRCIDTKTTSYSLMSILQLPELNLLACGSSVRHITLHDPRTTSKITNEQLNGHKNFVVSLDRHPTNPNMFVSASHDSTCKIWDVRSNKPLYTITRENSVEDNKVFAVKWSESINAVVSAGEDKQIQFNKTENII